MVVSAEDLSARFGWRASEDESAGVGTTPSGPVVIPAGLREKLLAFASDAAPNECCGIGIGPSGRIAEFHPLPNTHETPVTRYHIAPGDQMRVFKSALERDWDFTLVFHSHPATEPYPSVTDVSLAGWPDAVYIIAGLAGGPRLRAYRIVGGQISELEIAVGP